MVTKERSIQKSADRQPSDRRFLGVGLNGKILLGLGDFWLSWVSVVF